MNLQNRRIFIKYVLWGAGAFTISGIFQNSLKKRHTFEDVVFLDTLKTEKQIFSDKEMVSESQIKLPAACRGELNPKRLNVDMNFFERFRTIKSECIKNGDLLFARRIPVIGGFVIYNYWKSKESYDSFKEAIDVVKLKQELSNNAIRIVSVSQKTRSFLF